MRRLSSETEMGGFKFCKNLKLKPLLEKNPYHLVFELSDKLSRTIYPR